MNDLISRQAAIDALMEKFKRIPTTAIRAKDALEALPSAQPVIRCKDCKHSFLHDNGERISRICGLTRMCGTTPDDWFCADAERKTDV